MAVPKDPKTLEEAEPFVSLFPVDPAVLKMVTASMRDRGFDPDHPLLAWRDAFGEHGRTVVVDGHTRRLAAIKAGVKEVRVTVRRFKDVDEAIAATIGEQATRRNLSSAQLAVYVIEALGRLDDGLRGQGARNDLYGHSARELSEMLGVGTRTIERARKLIDMGDPELLAQVKRGDLSLRAAVEGGQDHVDQPIQGQVTVDEAIADAEPAKLSDRLAANAEGIKQREREKEEARAIAAIPKDIFDNYIATAPNPSTEGLLQIARAAEAALAPPQGADAASAPEPTGDTARQKVAKYMISMAFEAQLWLDALGTAIRESGDVVGLDDDDLTAVTAGARFLDELCTRIQASVS
jgi:ParB-like chromosome segregation protein Spo0J